MKPKKCRVCGYSFVQRSSTHVVCDLECAKILAIAVRKKTEEKLAAVERKADKVKREKLKTRAQWQKEAQAAFNAFIRERDTAAGLPCISCGRHHQGQNHAGHYLSRGSHPELAFDQSNVHLQCAPCNVYLSGNQAAYRKALIERIGIDEVERLEGPQEPRKPTIDVLASIKRDYTSAARKLKERNDKAKNAY